jgi:predicted MFS family arabinose efflux permease
MPYSILLPVFARDVLAAGSGGLGLMTAATGIGAMIGALGLARRHRRMRPGRTVAAAVAVLAAALLAFSASRALALSLALLVIVGAAMLVQMATSNTILQLLSPPELRGRIISVYMLAFMGMAPLGSLSAGALARGIGAPSTVAAGGAVCLLAAAWLAPRLARSEERDDIPHAGPT